MNRWQLCGSCALIGIAWIVFYPTGAAGQLLVSDRVSNQILEYNLDGSFRKALVPPSFPTLYTPSGMVLGNGSDLFVANENIGDNTYNVQRYNWRTGENLGGFDLGLNGPGGLLFDRASSTLYVSDFGGHQIVKYNTSTGDKTWLDAGAEVNGLADMALGQDGNLYVSNFWDGTVLRFNPTAQTFTGAPTTYFSGANGLVFDSSGNLDLVGMFTNNVYQFDSSGAPIRELIPMAGGGLN
ncbi:MAG: hypothetical protein ABSE63_15090, partial [Thermoguttaceae bacterium]